MYLKIHKSEEKTIVAVCDDNLIGKKFKDKGLMLNISKIFYKGKKVNEDDAVKIMKSGDMLNLVGENTIKVALKNNLILKQNIIKIKGIPHAQVI